MSNITKINGLLITAESASYAATASVVLGSITSASYSDTALSASYALTASYALNGGGAGVTINNNTDNYVVTATGTANTLNGESNLTFNGGVLSVTGDVTANSFTGSLQGTASYATQALTASYVAGASSFPFTGSALITGSLGVTGSFRVSSSAGNVIDTPFASLNWNNATSVEWANRILYDQNSAPAVDWSNRELKNTSGNTTLNWSSHVAADSAGNQSIDWTNRALYDASLNPSIDWGSRLLLDAATGLSIDWISRILYDSVGSSILDWENAQFNGNAATADTSTSASFATTAATASFVATAQTASFVTSSRVFGPNGANSILTASFATTASYALTTAPINPFPFSGSAVITGSLTVYNSGSSTIPLVKVQGGSGELFSVYDTFSGSLFSVNNQSGNPILEVRSDNKIHFGKPGYQGLLTTQETIVTASGQFTVYSIPTASYDGAWYEYVIRSGSNARAGQVMAVWSGSQVNYSETTTTAFGSTAGLSFGVFVVGANFALTGSATTGGWTMKTIIRSI